jgi:hypothetical protein
VSPDAASAASFSPLFDRALCYRNRTYSFSAPTIT